jgi:DNA processing protein
MSARSRIQLLAPITPITPSHADWPPALDDLTAAGAAAGVLYVAGELPRAQPCVAIVGTRFADAEGLAFARQLAADLTDAGHAVVSGGAEGIDAAAHAGCLEAGGHTVAVLATGLLHAYPAHHRALFETIATRGALVCESVSPSRVGRWSFLRRNRLIAALAEAVVVVQAPARSGACSTARWARSLQRRIFAVPAAAWDVRGQGCLALLRSGAQICTSAKDVLSLPPAAVGEGALCRPNRPKEHNDDNGLSEPARSLWQLLQRGPSQPDALGVCLDMPAARVQEGLLTLLLMGRARRRADGAYETTTRSP